MPVYRLMARTFFMLLQSEISTYLTSTKQEKNQDSLRWGLWVVSLAENVESVWTKAVWRILDSQARDGEPQLPGSS